MRRLPQGWWFLMRKSRTPRVRTYPRVIEYSERQALVGLLVLLGQELPSDTCAALLTARRLVRLLETIEEDVQRAATLADNGGVS